MDTNNNENNYHRSNNKKKAKVRARDIKQNPLSPKVYVPLIIFGIFVVLYVIANPFGRNSITVGGSVIKSGDFSNLKAQIAVTSTQPEKSGGQKVSITFTNPEVKGTIPIKDNITLISNHGVLTFKPDTNSIDLSAGHDVISGTLYGMQLPNDQVAIQLFSDQQKLLKQTPFQSLTFPMDIKKLFLQGSFQDSPDEPKIDVTLNMISNSLYEDNASSSSYNQSSKRNESKLNVSHGHIKTTVKQDAVYYRFEPDEAINISYYNGSSKSQTVFALKQYLDGETIPEKSLYKWQVEFKNNKFTLLWQDQTGKTQRVALSKNSKGSFETFAKAKAIPEPVDTSTTVQATSNSSSSSSSTSSSSSNSSSSSSSVNSGQLISQYNQSDLQKRVLALVIKHWPNDLSASQVKLFSLTMNGSPSYYNGVITYTYTTDGKENKINVMNYDLKSDGTVNYTSTSEYSPNAFSGNIFTDVTNDNLNTYFGK